VTGHVPKCREPICPKCGTEKTLYGKKRLQWQCPRCVQEVNCRLRQSLGYAERHRDYERMWYHKRKPDREFWERKRESNRKWRQSPKGRAYNKDYAHKRWQRAEVREQDNERMRETKRKQRATLNAINMHNAMNAVQQIVVDVSSREAEGE